MRYTDTYLYHSMYIIKHFYFIYLNTRVQGICLMTTRNYYERIHAPARARAYGNYFCVDVQKLCRAAYLIDKGTFSL